MSKLLPCPFCGKREPLQYDQVYDQYLVVICNAAKGGCGASGGGEELKEGAAKEWNQRHAPGGWKSKDNENNNLRRQVESMAEALAVCERALRSTAGNTVIGRHAERMASNALMNLSGEDDE